MFMKLYIVKKKKKAGMYKYGVFILFKRKTANRSILFPQKMLAKHILKLDNFSLVKVL